jgi:putative PIN family toxin of toxin-antitoxin system
MNKRPRIVLDTNVLLVSISSKSEFHWIFQKMLEEEFEVVISNEILSEYEEVISKKFSVEVASDVIRTLLLLPNIIKGEVYYRWSLLSIDKDDNKFIDCAIACNADFIVTNDDQFNLVKGVPFPPLKIMNINEFKELFF